MLGLGQQQDVGRGDQLGALQDAADEGPQLVVGDPEPFAVAGLQQHARPQLFGDPIEVTGMQRHASLVGLARDADDAEDEGCAGGHGGLLPSAGAEPTPWS